MSGGTGSSQRRWRSNFSWSTAGANHPRTSNTLKPPASLLDGGWRSSDVKAVSHRVPVYAERLVDLVGRSEQLNRVFSLSSEGMDSRRGWLFVLHFLSTIWILVKIIVSCS